MKLHLDADTSIKALARTLRDRGHDVTRTPTEWMPRDASDQEQLLGATAQGRSLFTFNIRDFMALVQVYPHHHGLILAHQADWGLSGLIQSLDALLREAPDLRQQVVWLNRWRR